jgi:hypothetical protein
VKQLEELETSELLDGPVEVEPTQSAILQGGTFSPTPKGSKKAAARPRSSTAAAAAASAAGPAATAAPAAAPAPPPPRSAADLQQALVLVEEAEEDKEALAAAAVAAVAARHGPGAAQPAMLPLAPMALLLPQAGTAPAHPQALASQLAFGGWVPPGTPATGQEPLPALLQSPPVAKPDPELAVQQPWSPGVGSVGAGWPTLPASLMPQPAPAAVLTVEQLLAASLAGPVPPGATQLLAQQQQQPEPAQGAAAAAAVAPKPAAARKRAAGGQRKSKAAQAAALNSEEEDADGGRYRPGWAPPVPAWKPAKESDEDYEAFEAPAKKKRAPKKPKAGHLEEPVQEGGWVLDPHQPIIYRAGKAGARKGGGVLRGHGCARESSWGCKVSP